MTITINETSLTVISEDDFHGWTFLKEDDENVFSLAELDFKSLEEVEQAGYSYICFAQSASENLDDFTIVIQTYEDAVAFAEQQDIVYRRLVIVAN